MLKTAILLGCVALVSCQTPMDVVPATNCFSDGDCQLFDGLARCEAGDCVCSRATDTTTKCTELASGLIEITISFIFGEADCTVFQADPTAESTLRGSILGSLLFTVLRYDLICGSVIFVSTIQSSANDIDAAIAQATAGVVAAQAGIPSLASSSLTTTVSIGTGTKQCQLDNSASTLILEGVCVPTCLQGFDRITITGQNTTTGNATRSYECRSPDSDDDLTATGVAAVVVACLLFCGIIGAVVYFCMGKSNSGVPTGNVENEPFNDEKPADQPAEGGAANDITV
eukprot:TRINITY_DN2586_c0_g2_i3.p1 TRINITY_DN2586_c0_g2~~TRINITY_DN2586_c0_g2_i3.p1  ORF type:complete len:286 (+),score=100.22 TRINITY_DN2586_c0_g2_i3:81-938(+)